MTSIIIISILPIVLLYLGLYKAQKALLPVAVLGLLAALVTSVMQWKTNAVPEFNGMLLYDNFSVAFSVISIITTVLILLLSKGYFERISNHIAEYYAIILFSLAVSLYILAGIRKNDFASNEAALKYFLMGAFSTGFLLFGIALIYGSTGTFDLDGIRDWGTDEPTQDRPAVGAAPFHFWTPDVYEGAPSLITLFMSTVVKVAGFAAFLRLFSACFLPIAQFWTPVLLVITTLTLFIGNITALYQQSFKRYLLFAIVAIGAGSANSIFVYATAYSIASVIAFGALILVRQQSGTDNFEGFNGLAARNPFLALVLTISMLSLAGALSQYRVWLVVVAIVNAIISIFYYFRVIIAMYFRSAEREQVEIPAYYKLVLGFSALVITRGTGLGTAQGRCCLARTIRIVKVDFKKFSLYNIVGAIAWHPWHQVSPGDNTPEIVNAIIEIPKGSKGKYEIDKESGLLKLDRVLFSSVMYPANYGFIPQTYCDDKDPLDILVLCSTDVYPMSIIEAKVVGVMHMVDNGEQDDKIIAVAKNDMSVNYINDLNELPPHFMKEIVRFFSDYKVLEGKNVTIEHLLGVRYAHKVIEESLELYKTTFPVHQ
ncbi:hypothetical protein Lal_00049046 [Lupinus albus]|nr:hypothetical protein Lal_00049046 [Lupinus albus]